MRGGAGDMRYILYNNDCPVAKFNVVGGVVKQYIPYAKKKHLLPKQIFSTTADGFAMWIQDRAIDLNTLQHRMLVHALTGSRDRISVALATNMFSISDTFTCFKEGEFVRRSELCNPNDQNEVSNFILVSSDTSIRKAGLITPNASTDGSFPKTWKYEKGTWWLYKIQSIAATRGECEISRVLRQSGFDAAEYRYDGSYRKRIKSKNFVGADEFFEPYDCFRFVFEDRSDDDEVIYRNIASMGPEFERSWRRILLADALFLNTDRHMRNFGVIRSALTGEVLRLAPNFDNNQAFLANPGGRYSTSMLKLFRRYMGWTDQDEQDLALLLENCRKNKYLSSLCSPVEEMLLSEI